MHILHSCVREPVLIVTILLKLLIVKYNYDTVVNFTHTFGTLNIIVEAEGVEPLVFKFIKIN